MSQFKRWTQSNIDNKCRIRVWARDGRMIDEITVPTKSGGVNYCHRHPTGKYGRRFYTALVRAVEHEQGPLERVVLIDRYKGLSYCSVFEAPVHTTGSDGICGVGVDITPTIKGWGPPSPIAIPIRPDEEQRFIHEVGAVRGQDL